MEQTARKRRRQKETRKKGDLSIQTLVMVILALIVLVVISAVFVGKMRESSKNLSSCASKNGQCLPPSQCAGPDDVKAAFVKCERAEEVCCLGKQDEIFKESGTVSN